MKEVNPVKRQKVKIREIRKQLGLTQEEFSEYLGINRVNLSKFEGGKRPIEWLEKAVKLQRLLKQAGYDIEDLALPTDSAPIIGSNEN